MATEVITVQQVVPRGVTTKFGPKTAFDIMATNGQKYQHGFKDPKVMPGETITVEVNHGKYGPDVTAITRGAAVPPLGTLPYAPLAVHGSAIPVTGGTVAAPAFVARDNFLQGNRAFPLPQTHGDRSFVRQHALTAAIAVADAEGGARAEDIIETARKFEAYCAGDDDLLAAKEATVQTAAQVALGAHQGAGYLASINKSS